jgi:glycine cleavage system H protein
MLGEMVDHGFELTPQAPVSPGAVVGWVEGFKALTEILCIAQGEFAGGNALLKEDISVISRDPYEAGWIYRVKGEPDAHCTDVEGYRGILDATIDRILEKQKREEPR